MRILLVEDDPVLGRALEVGLARDGYTVYWAHDGIEAYTTFQNGKCEALVLDLGLPELGGLDLLHRVRQADWQVPVLVITARAALSDRVQGLDLGADDYLSKPFDLDELLARLRAVTRRARGALGNTMTVRDVVVELHSHRVTRAGEPVWLTGREYSVMRLLLDSAGSIVPRQKIEEHLSGWGVESEANLIEVYIHNLRKKLGSDFIQTYRGQGYKISL